MPKSRQLYGIRVVDVDDIRVVGAIRNVGNIRVVDDDDLPLNRMLIVAGSNLQNQSIES